MLDQSPPVAGVHGRRVSQRDGDACLFSPGLATRVAARVRRLELDRALADGADPTASPLLAARAGQLVTAASRYRVAGGLERVALTVDADPGRFRTPPHRDAVRANRAEMLRLAATLRHDGPLYARAIACLELILIDGTGPAYTDPRGEGLARQLQLAADSLTG